MEQFSATEVVLLLNKVENKVYIRILHAKKPYFQPYLTTKKPQ